MATTLPSSFSSSVPPPPPGYNHSSPSKHDLFGLSLPFPFLTPPSTSLRAAISSNPRKYRPITLTLASSSSSHSASFSSFDDLGSDTTPPLVGDKKSLLADLIQEIEPLDVSLIQKDVPPMTLDAIKRTISGMLGLLPSDRFQVFIEALWEPLSKLLVSSMMTGYTLRNAEYRLCLERNFDIHEGDPRKQTPDDINLDLLGIASDAAESSEAFGENAKSEFYNEDSSNYDSIKGLGEMSSQAQQYILHLQSQLSSLRKELHEVKRKGAALQMQQFVGEEKNDLLDYLRSLQPEKVAELSEPTSPELKETIHSLVHGLLATLSPKMHSKTPSQSENPSAGTINIGIEDCAELVENTSLQFQPLISLTRDYLARLLFWCMLLGHYLRGLEYRMELMELLSLSSDVKNE